MANTEIDSLSLDIKITGLDEDSIKNLDKLSKSVQRLTKALSEADFSKLNQIKLPKGANNIQIITQKFGSSIADAVSALNDTSLQDNALQETITETAQALDDSSLLVQKATGKVTVSLIEFKKLMKEAMEAVEGKKAKKSNFFEKSLKKIQKILKRFKTITFIKAVRAILNAVVNAVKTGATNLANFDKTFSGTLDKLKTNALQMVNSLILIARPFIEFLQPFITGLANALIEISNAVSKVTAVMQNSSKYTKINADYMEKFAKASQKASLFSFDTFTSLSGDETSNSMFTEEDVEDADATKASELFTLMANIKELFQNIYSILQTIFSEIKVILEYISPIINRLLSFINNILGKVNVILGKIFKAINPILEAVAELVDSLLNVLTAILEPILDLVVEILDPIMDIISALIEVLKPILDVISNWLKTFATAMGEIFKTISKVLGKDIGEFLSTIVKQIEPLITAVKIVANILNQITGIFNDIVNFKFDKLGEKLKQLGKDILKGILSLLVKLLESVVNFAIDAINVLLKPIDWIADWFGGNVEIPHVSFDWMMPNFATGGVVGEIWQMNEYGTPEMLYGQNGGSDTSVITQAQLSLAFEQAIYNTGLIDAIKQSGNIVLDGRQIAQSKSFKNELNRTNPNLNIR